MSTAVRRKNTLGLFKAEFATQPLKDADAAELPLRKRRVVEMAIDGLRFESDNDDPRWHDLAVLVHEARTELESMTVHIAEEGGVR